MTEGKESRSSQEHEYQQQQIEANKEMQKSQQETQKTIHENWQKTINHVTDVIRDYAALGKKTE